jgi:ubiquinone biosynthesis monooxygenase Coq6
MNRKLIRALATTTANSKHADIIIVGGGIVGSALACGIGMSSYAKNKSIVLIEAGDLLTPQQIIPNEYSNRVSSLTPKTLKFLKELQVEIPIERKTTYTNMNVWDTTSGSLQFGDGSEPIATMVENRLLQAALADRINSLPNITLFNKTKVSSIEKVEFPTITLESGVKYSCDLLVGADGPNSTVREISGIQTSGFDYDQMGMVGTVQIEESDNTTAYQRFLPSGPVALLPLSKTMSSIVWSLPKNIAVRVSKLESIKFAALLNCAFNNPVEDVKYLLSEINEDGTTEVDFEDERQWGLSRAPALPSTNTTPLVIDVVDKSRGCFPLKLRHAEKYSVDRIVLVGDAAHTVHPLAGQGLNLGLGDADSLSLCLSKAFRDGQDIGHLHSLEGYEFERYAENAGMLLACDFINRLFSNESEFLAFARDLGMNTLNSVGPLKKAIMHIHS